MIWNIINQLTNKNRKNNNMNNITYTSNKLTSPADIATAFNEFYTNVALELDHSLVQSAIIL